MREQNRGILLLATFSLITGMGGYVVKSSHGLNPQQVLFFRAVLACVFLLGVAVATKRLKEIKFKYPTPTIIMGVVQGLSIFFFYAALEKTTITNAILLTYTAPIFSAVLAGMFLKEKIEQKTVLAIALSLAGVALVNNPTQFSWGSEQWLGSVYALLGAFFYGAMAISSKAVSQKTTPLYAAFWQYLVIMIAFAVFALPVPMNLVSDNLLALLYLGWAAGGLAFLLFMIGVKLVKGQIIQVVTMMEVVVATLSGALLLGEKLTLPVVLGGSLILSGVLVVSGDKVRSKDKD